LEQDVEPEWAGAIRPDFRSDGPSEDPVDGPARPIAPGLYLVATPIGNLEDITLRALRVLRSVDRIACEDTRQSQKLLNHYGIRTPTISCHAHNEGARTPELLALLTAGGRLAVISDAGTPGISDPGMHLASAAIAAGVAVYPIPGANAALNALVASGLGTGRFTFCGFLPEKAGARRTELERLADSLASAADPTTLVFYEAPHRILETLADLAAVWPQARMVIGRELTKLHEEFLRGTSAELACELGSRERVRGEMVVLVEAGPRAQAPATATIGARVAELVAAEGIDEKDALKRVARERGLGKSDAYRELQRERGRR
jgi:16S rRNA (cytidine1402-2'-O)-methyltransferase